jgi:hypothetical protein
MLYATDEQFNKKLILFVNEYIRFIFYIVWIYIIK